MESSSVYMCFPCYQEFPTLEEVLAHQMTCTAENPQLLPNETPIEAAAAAAGLAQVAMQAVSVPQIQTQTAVDLSSLLEQKKTLQADAPRVLYQCADCEVLFDALSLWQHHRKMGCCLETGPGPGGEQSRESVETATQPVPSHPEYQAQNAHEQMEAKDEGRQAEMNMENTTQVFVAAGEVSERVDAPDGVPSEPPETSDTQETAPVESSAEENSSATRRRGQKKAKPPSSLLCVECGQSFSLVPELVTHRKTQHGLKDAIHRCTVCGEGFLNTTLFLYHRKQHRSEVEDKPKQAQPAIPQLSTAMLEAPGEGLLLLAAAGEGQSLMEVTTLEQTITETPVAHVEVELDNDGMRGSEALQTEQEPAMEGTEVFVEMVEESNGANQEEGMEVVIDKMQEDVEMEKSTVVEEIQGEVESSTDKKPGKAPSSSTEGQHFLCHQCGSVFTSVQKLAQHRRTDHGLEAALHTCEECGAEYISTTQFLYHRREHKNAAAKEPGKAPSPSTEEQNFLCHQCGSVFTSDQELAQHRRTEHGLEAALHTCAECGAEFMSTTQFLYHRREHKNAAAGQPPASEVKGRLYPTAAPAVVVKPRDNVNLRQPAAAAAAADGAIEAPAKLSRDWSRTALPHECPHCGQGFTRRSRLREHVFQHTGEKLFNCKICKKSFPSPANLLRHNLTHGGSRVFSCPLCDKRFFQPTSLKRHMLIHQGGESQERKVRGRGKGRGQSSDGRLHICPECPASFKFEAQLNSHRLLHTSHPFPCNVCGEAFIRRKELDLHSLIHQDKEPKTCPNCSSQFLNQTVLDTHLQRCTGEEMGHRKYKGQGRGKVGGQLECDMCGHRCVTQDGLDLHRLSHTGQTPLRCPLTPCRRRFASSAALGEHLLAHCCGALGKRNAPRRFTCEFCGKEFAYVSTFTVHMRTHTNERPFECTYCGKRFRQLPHLQDHERIHSGERPFTCWVCGKSFSVAARLTEHARVHSGERPYICPRCPTAFRSRPNLDKHMRLHANDPVDPSAQNMDDDAAVQTILLVQESTSSSPSSSSSAVPVVQEGMLVAEEGSSSVVFLHPNLTMPTITVPTISVPNISVVAGQDVPHTIEVILEETV
ncbi:zinc finger protein 574-like isoform X1 [Cyprinus carpio]|uniref:Zinc finger protein 574-like isoform X1 n=1 Tax=Cyprinus carpio TaxID=7962 RepID=A0A9Q9YYC3_CYPCA|nr:zinc finger protein 574-like isoform X1 [Cyprinus carpio]XP_042628016.1 zinc finger protein 574-like isoform X1 [Cyprinus carpio]